MLFSPVFIRSLNETVKMFLGQNWTHTHRFGLKIRPDRSHRCSGRDGLAILAPSLLPRLVFDGFGVGFGFFRWCCLNNSVNRITIEKLFCGLSYASFILIPLAVAP